MRLDGCLDMSCMRGARVYMFVGLVFAPLIILTTSLLAITTTAIYYTIMGYKSTYQELVYKQPPSFAKRVEYRIPKFQKPLGRGSTGKVVRAKWIDGGLEKKVALKYVLFLSSHFSPFLPYFTFTLTLTDENVNA